MPHKQPDTSLGGELVSLHHIVKDYPGVRAVDDVSLTLKPGQVHGLVGENGAGKSTLIKILAGAVPKDRGEIKLRGRRVEINSVQDAYRLGLAFIHQELNLIPYFDAAENIFLGHAYPKTRLGKIDWKALRKQTTRILQQLGTDLPVNVPVSRLTPGQQTMISIARGLASAASLVVLDEPTASLTDNEIDHLYAAIRALCQRGTGVVYVSHRLSEIFEIADSVTIMRNGRIIATEPTQALDEPSLIQLMTGRAVDTLFPARESPSEHPLLVVEKLCGDFIRDISFSLHAGEVLGIAGLVGSGRSELLHMLFGAAPIRSGKILADGKSVLHPTSPSDAFQAGIALVPEERRSQSLLLRRPIFENVTLSNLAQYARGGLVLDRERELFATQQLGATLGLKAASLRQPVEQLSGGNQQKVVFARCLAGEARLLLLDEPTRGVDVGAKHELYQLMVRLTAQGVGILLVSSELPELLGLSHRILVLHEGRQTALLQEGSSDEEAVLRYCYGLP